MSLSFFLIIWLKVFQYKSGERISIQLLKPHEDLSASVRTQICKFMEWFEKSGKEWFWEIETWQLSSDVTWQVHGMILRNLAKNEFEKLRKPGNNFQGFWDSSIHCDVNRPPLLCLKFPPNHHQPPFFPQLETGIDESEDRLVSSIQTKKLSPIEL